MPRQSVHAVSAAAKRINAHQRPEPPESLNGEAADEWRKVVARLPPEWFPTETHALLEDRCRQIVWLRETHRSITALIKKGNYSQKDYYNLVRLSTMQSRTIAALDTRMRLTQQTSNGHRKRKPTVKTSKPWDSTIEGSEEDQE